MENQRVVELVTTASDIARMYHPGIKWMDVSAVQGIAEGWVYDGTTFSKPVASAAAPLRPTIAELQAQLAAISAQLAAMAKPS